MSGARPLLAANAPRTSEAVAHFPPRRDGMHAASGAGGLK